LAAQPHVLANTAIETRYANGSGLEDP
jgi:hypothetical protein